MKRSVVGLGALGVALTVVLGHGSAQAADVGKQEYRDNCTSCHGVDGTGSGPVAGFLKQRPANLTMLEKNNAGVFPFARVYDVIDGRQAVALHGPRDMPIWGKTFEAEGEKHGGGEALPDELTSYARGRIVALIGYISSFQEK